MLRALAVLLPMFAAASTQPEFGPHFKPPTIRPPIQCFSCATLDFRRWLEFGPHFKPPTIRPPIQCFSCATLDFREMWKVAEERNGVYPISAYLNEPRVFTADCDTGLKFLRSHPTFALTWCNSSCITITEQATIGAIPYDNYIRGCASELFKLTRTRRIMSRYSLLHLPRPSAHRCGFEITLEDLYGGPAEHRVDVCSCGWDKCNSWPYDPAEYGEPAPDPLMHIANSAPALLAPSLLLLLALAH